LTRESFEQGLTHLQSARFADAGASFRDAIRPGVDTTAALTYLAVCLAATGHDREAIVIWRQAHDTGGRGLPQIYEWLGDALMRTRDFGQARPMLEEAAKLWPSDVRFARQLALIYAISGRGRDAVRSMERFVRDNPTDLDALFLGLEWLFDLRRAGIVVRSVPEDVELARSFRDLYVKGNGPNQPLASLWLDYLAKH
jgi:Flp pilus assembly protein TadD